MTPPFLDRPSGYSFEVRVRREALAYQRVVFDLLADGVVVRSRGDEDRRSWRLSMSIADEAGLEVARQRLERYFGDRLVQAPGEPAAPKP